MYCGSGLKKDLFVVVVLVISLLSNIRSYKIEFARSKYKSYRMKLIRFFRLFVSCCSHLRRLENTDNLYKILNKNVLARGLGAWTEFTFSPVFKKSVIFMNEITFGMHFLLQWKVCFCKSEYIIVFHLLRIFRFEYCMHNIHKLNHYAPKETLSIFFKKIIELNNFLKLILMFSLNFFSQNKAWKLIA